MARYLCIHGHFYQPPRENPWLGVIEPQDSARPFRDWNARIAAECYVPNAAARILDGDGRIARIVNNYARISFNFGPTLLEWLAAEEPAAYAAVLAADRESAERFSGHGSAMAQGYNHIILPLANRRDKETQIVWGLRDFAHRFGRPAAGMWLPETAVDLETLDLLALHGVRFTILEPHQARRVRPLAPLSGMPAAARRPRRHHHHHQHHQAHPAPPADPPPEWQDVSGGRIDTSQPYAVALPSGRSIAVFFYDGPAARGVAFENVLGSGERFAERLLAGQPNEGPDRLAHIATDGETYGHHHRHGEMALAYALHQVETHGWATLTNYAAYLAAHPPAAEVEIVEHSSWSCVHGVDRWRDDCGCRLGGPAGWNQAWRAPLRQALDELRDELIPLYEDAAGELFASPWEARDDAIALLLDRSPAAVGAFLERHARGAVPAGERRARALRLLEMQRHAMLMYTSCGWFFDDLAGLEAVQVLRYAGRTAQLADELFGGRHEQDLLRHLAWARSNDPAAGTGRDLYAAHVRPVHGAAAPPRCGAAAHSAASAPEGAAAEGATGFAAARGATGAAAFESTTGVAAVERNLARALEGILERLLVAPDEPGLLPRAASLAALAAAPPFTVDLWQAQNLGCALREAVHAPRRAGGGVPDAGAAATWSADFRRLAAALAIRAD